MNPTRHSHPHRRPAPLTVREEVALIGALVLAFATGVGAAATLLVLSPASPTTFATMSAVLTIPLVTVRRLILSAGRDAHPIRPAANACMSVER